MRGKKRTTEEQNELFVELERFLAMGFSLKKACSLANLPYSSVRDIVAISKPLRAYTTALQNDVNVKARLNIIDQIEKGDIKASQWWLERFDTPEPQHNPVFGGASEIQEALYEAQRDLNEGVTTERIDEFKLLHRALMSD